MSVRIRDYTPLAKIEFTRKASLFLRYFAEEVQKIADPVTPKDTGQLRRSVLKQVLGLKGKIEWRKKYAAVQEVGKRGGIKFRNYTTAGTGKNYAKKSIKEAKRREVKLMRRARLI